MSETLKPCPFCGGEAKLHESYFGGYLVGCHGKCWVVTQRYETESEAIEAWNTRVKPPCGSNYCPLCGAKVVDA